LESIFQLRESFNENRKELEQDVDNYKEDVNIKHMSLKEIIQKYKLLKSQKIPRF